MKFPQKSISALLLLSCVFLFGIQDLSFAHDPGYFQYEKSDGDVKVTGRIYHAARGQVWVEVWPQPYKKKVKVDKFSLNSPSGKRYKPDDMMNVPISQVDSARQNYFKDKHKHSGKLMAKISEWFIGTAHANCSVEHSGGGGGGESGESSGGSSGSEGISRRDTEAFATFGMLAGIAGATENDWVMTGGMQVEEEKGEWDIKITVKDGKSKKYRFTIPFQLSRIPTPGAFASSFNPETGQTTTSFTDTDGNRTITVTDAGGKVVSTRTISKDDKPEPEKKKPAPASISSTDTATGITTTVTDNGDGTKTVMVTDADGTVVSTNTQPKSQGSNTTTYTDPETGYHITVVENPDGSISTTAEDDDGNQVTMRRWPNGRPDPEPVQPEQPKPEPQPEPTPEEPQEPQDPEDDDITDADPGWIDIPTEPTDPVSTPDPEPTPKKVGVALMLSDKDWIPRYQNSTLLFAQIYEPDPANPSKWIISTETAKVKIFFTERSNEPGQAMNEPLPGGSQGTPDLYFKREDNPNFNCNGPIAVYNDECRSKERRSTHVIDVDSEDYGAFSAVDVNCTDRPCVLLKATKPYLTNGESPSATAFEEPDQKRRQVYVPKDIMGNRNFIADRWEEIQRYYPAAGVDNDFIPRGIGESGDGLSAYEEYRGFVDRSNIHRRTSWRRKTLIVENKSGQSLAKFRRQSRIQVIEVKDGGLKDRIANWKYKTAHIVDQHGIVAISRAEGGGRAVGGPGRPKKIVHVEAGATDLNAFQHEMGHAVNMWHHGEFPWNLDSSGNYAKHWIYPQTNGFMDLFRHIHPGRQLCGTTLPAQYSIGVKGDQGSGDYDCLMRYGGSRWKDVYPQQKSYDYHCHVRRATDETTFCTSLNGTRNNGFNSTAANATKDAACMNQIAIKTNG